MDNDLISRNKTVQLLRTYADEVGCKRGEYELANGILKAVCFLSDSANVPTAYDLDSVMERLKEERENAWDLCDGGARYSAYDNALDIVRSGIS